METIKQTQILNDIQNLKALQERQNIVQKQIKEDIKNYIKDTHLISELNWRLTYYEAAWDGSFVMDSDISSNHILCEMMRDNDLRRIYLAQDVSLMTHSHLVAQNITQLRLNVYKNLFALWTNEHIIHGSKIFTGTEFENFVFNENKEAYYIESK